MQRRLRVDRWARRARQRECGGMRDRAGREDGLVCARNCGRRRRDYVVVVRAIDGVGGFDEIDVGSVSE